MHAFNQYSLNSFITVFETAVTGKRARPRWMGGTGNALLDQILPKPKKKGLWGRKVDMTHPNPNPNLNPNPSPNPDPDPNPNPHPHPTQVDMKKVIATGKTKEQLDARLKQLLENTTFQV